MKVFAHRCASGDYPENTILSLKKALDFDIYGLEIDVHKCMDGHLVIIHNDIFKEHLKERDL